MKSKLSRKQSAASAMFHDGSDRMRSSTGHRTLITSFDRAEAIERRSSIAVLRDNGTIDDQTNGMMESGERPSWWERPEGSSKSWVQRAGLAIALLMFAGVGVGLYYAAHLTNHRALPFIFAVLAALAIYESTWLSYRLRLRLFLPFKLHQKQTCRDIYQQIMNYTVDLQTCAITPIAERAFRGRKLLAAAVTALVAGVVSFPIAWFSVDSKTLVAYITVTSFLAVWCAALAPNLRDATVLLFQYTCFALSTASVLLLNNSVTLEPLHLVQLTAAIIFITRALTSKDPMETVVMALLDVAALVYLVALSTVVCQLAALTAQFNKMDEATERRHTILFGVFFVIWSAEFGSYLMEKLLREAQFPWTHPLSSRLSSRQNLEKLVGALIFGVSASFLVTDVLLSDDTLPVHNIVFMATSIGAITCSHVAKLWLISLKKVARVSATGKYLSIGDGVIDRLDSALFGVIVFTIVLRRVIV